MSYEPEQWAEVGTTSQNRDVGHPSFGRRQRTNAGILRYAQNDSLPWEGLEADGTGLCWGSEREESGNGEADDLVWGGADCAGSVGILRDGKRAPNGADSGVLRAGAGGVRGTGEDGEREAANAVDACCGDGGAAGVSGVGIAGGGGVYQGARRAVDGYGGGCGEGPGGG